MAYISKVKLPNNSSYDLKDSGAHWYGNCTTAAATAAKECTIEGFAREAGTKVVITFTYANSAASPTLSINEETAAPLALMNGNVALWDDGETCEFIFDGTNWNLINYGKVEVIRL